ncbi:hypothetical protein C2S53_007646 [Perilla frutescens var. hirtella]|uniref:RING-type domain-containing protein n=1 Tax=Perilla frutescens var. hirtella TaxID=608512 RepID=A0AAD4JKS9_PERFH|nr:hypothetical protein C2S53_007646 [Perilla frutescens var. hirtella]
MSLICRKLGISQNGVFFKLLNKIYVALLTCIFALGGGAVGAIAGAIKGQTTETGFSRGLFVGAVTGAVTGVQLMDLHPFSKVALISSLVNGKIFMEWVSPALLKAYQWQVISSTETSMSEFSDIFDVVTLEGVGLSPDSIKELPVHDFYDAHTSHTPLSLQTSCVICLQKLKNGEAARSLPSCKHMFHLHCIDQWLMRQGSCPICRKQIESKSL